MKTNLFITFFLLLLVPSLLSAQSKKQNSKEALKHRVVIQFNDPDSVSQVRVILQAENIRKVWPEAEIELVCLGGGLDLLTKRNSKANKMVSDWADKGIIFAACNNTMINRNIKAEDLLPQATVVPAAVIELARRQEEGWSYFRGGK
jgi:uncharacterized protein